VSEETDALIVRTSTVRRSRSFHTRSQRPSTLGLVRRQSGQTAPFWIHVFLL